MPSRALGHRAPLLWLVLPYACGLGAGRCAPPAPPGVLLALALGAALFSLAAAWRRPGAWAAPLLAAGFLAGWASIRLHVGLTGREGLPPREARLALRLDRVDPAEIPQAHASRRRGAAPPGLRLTGTATVAGAGRHLGDLVGRTVHFSIALRRGQEPPVRSALIAATGILETFRRGRRPDRPTRAWRRRECPCA